MEIGKLPPELLSELIADTGAPDPRVLLGPAVGEDCAVLNMEGRNMDGRRIIATADPITFAAERAGWYAVQVNANDIACSGGIPRWFLPTALLPASSTPDDARRLFADMARACRELDIAIIGGHTEVTGAVTQTVIAGAMLGEPARPGRVISAGGAQDGDSIILTTGIAIEGTAILAAECAGELRAAGIAADAIARAAACLDDPGISVVKAARALCDAAADDLHSLHDITEGGLVTALREVAAASRLGLVLEAESTPVLPECAAICTALQIDPLGLIGSGALLAAMPAGAVPNALRALDRIGVSGWEIGQMIEPELGLWLIDRAGERPMPQFRRDELARYLEQRGHPQSTVS